MFTAHDLDQRLDKRLLKQFQSQSTFSINQLPLLLDWQASKHSYKKNIFQALGAFDTSLQAAKFGNSEM